MGRAKVRLIDQFLGRGGVVSVSVVPSRLNEGPGVSDGVQVWEFEGERPLLLAAILPPPPP